MIRTRHEGLKTERIENVEKRDAPGFIEMGGDFIKKQSIDEMKHADQLVERILFLQGLPNLQDLGKLLIGENTKEMLECDLKLEHKAHTDLKSAVAYCESVSDYVSRDLCVEIMESEEEHIDWLETQLGLIEKVGLENYLQTAMHTVKPA